MYNKLKQKNISVEEVLKAAFEENAAPTAIYNLDTTIAMVNDAYCETSGYTREEVIGMSWLKLLPPGEFERLKEYNTQRLANPETAPNKYEFAFNTKNGDLKYGFASITTLLESELIIMSIVDITAAKLLAEDRDRKNQELQKLIETRNKDIALSVSQLVANNDNNKWLLSKMEELKEMVKQDIQSLLPVIQEIEENYYQEIATRLLGKSAATVSNIVSRFAY